MGRPTSYPTVSKRVAANPSMGVIRLHGQATERLGAKRQPRLSKHRNRRLALASILLREMRSLVHTEEVASQGPWAVYRPSTSTTDHEQQPRSTKKGQVRAKAAPFARIAQPLDQ